MSFLKHKSQNLLSQALRPLSAAPTKSTERPSRQISEATAFDSDAELGVLELVVLDAIDLELSSAAKPFITLNLNGASSHSRPATKYRDADPSCPVWEYPVQHDVAALDSLGSDRSALLSVYDAAHSNALLGVARLNVPDPLPTEICEHWLSLEGPSGQMIQGSIRVTVKFTPRLKSSGGICYNDFEIIKQIGRGNFGIVYKVRKKDTKKIYAMKVLSKSAIKKSKTVANVLSERKVLQHTRMHNSPFLVGLKFSFQTETHLYFVMDYKSGGELFQHMQFEGGKFREGRVRFYIAEVLLALETLHKHNIIYRDLKPENILLDEEGHIALCDFGLSRALEGKAERAKSFCGTTEYLPPEIINDCETNGYDRMVDYWAMGVLMFEMLAGFTPFYSEERQDKFKKIVSSKLKIPSRGVSDNARDLLTRLLTRAPEDRIGARGPNEMKHHPFFEGMDWQALATRKVMPPFKPVVEDDDPIYSARASATPGLTDSESDHTSRRSSCITPDDEKEEPEARVDWFKDWTFAGSDSRRGSNASQHTLHRGNSFHQKSGSLGMSTLPLDP